MYIHLFINKYLNEKNMIRLAYTTVTTNLFALGLRAHKGGEGSVELIKPF